MTWESAGLTTYPCGGKHCDLLVEFRRKKSVSLSEIWVECDSHLLWKTTVLTDLVFAYLMDVNRMMHIIGHLSPSFSFDEYTICSHCKHSVFTLPKNTNSDFVTFILGRIDECTNAGANIENPINLLNDQCKLWEVEQNTTSKLHAVITGRSLSDMMVTDDPYKIKWAYTNKWWYRTKYSIYCPVINTHDKPRQTWCTHITDCRGSKVLTTTHHCFPIFCKDFDASMCVFNGMLMANCTEAFFSFFEYSSYVTKNCKCFYPVDGVIERLSYSETAGALKYRKLHHKISFASDCDSD